MTSGHEPPAICLVLVYRSVSGSCHHDDSSSDSSSGSVSKQSKLSCVHLRLRLRERTVRPVVSR